MKDVLRHLAGLGNRNLDEAIFSANSTKKAVVIEAFVTYLIGLPQEKKAALRNLERLVNEKFVTIPQGESSDDELQALFDSLYQRIEKAIKDGVKIR
jgi:hypothetical protein